MPNTDRELLIAVLAVVDGVAELEGSVTVEAAKHHIASTPDTGSECDECAKSVILPHECPNDTGSDGAAEDLLAELRATHKCFAAGLNTQLDFNTAVARICDRSNDLPTPTPSPPIPDSTDDDPEIADAMNSHGMYDTPDTGGVEGPEFTYGKDKRTDDWVLWLNGSEIVRSPDGWWGEPDKPLSIRNDATLAFCLAAYSEGHKAGASGSGEAVAKAIEALRAAEDQIANEPAVCTDGQRAKIREIASITARAYLAAQNPASGSDGLREAAANDVVAAVCGLETALTKADRTALSPEASGALRRLGIATERLDAALNGGER